jgi:hypothetical protein
MSKCRELSIWLFLVSTIGIGFAGGLIVTIYGVKAIMWMLGAIPSPWPLLDKVILLGKLGAAIGAFIGTSLWLQEYCGWGRGRLK